MQGRALDNVASASLKYNRRLHIYIRNPIMQEKGRHTPNLDIYRRIIAVYFSPLITENRFSMGY